MSRLGRSVPQAPKFAPTPPPPLYAPPVIESYHALFGQLEAFLKDSALSPFAGEWIPVEVGVHDNSVGEIRVALKVIPSAALLAKAATPATLPMLAPEPPKAA